MTNSNCTNTVVVISLNWYITENRISSLLKATYYQRLILLWVLWAEMQTSLMMGIIDDTRQFVCLISIHG